MNSKMFEFKLIIVITLVGTLNSFFYDNFLVMLVLAIIEVCYLMLCFFNHKDLLYLLNYMVFLAFSMENASFVGEDIFYGFKNFRILGLNLGIWMILPLFIRQVVKLKSQKKIFPKYLTRFIKGVIFITLSGLIMGLISYGLNDNGIMLIPGSMKQFINSIYIYIFVCIEVITVSIVLVNNKNKLFKVRQYLSGSIVALSIVCVLCIVFQNYGNRGGLSSLQISNIYFLLVSSILILSYELTSKEKIIMLISSSVILISSLVYNASGKMIILTAATPLIMIVILFKKKKSLKNIIIGMVLLFSSSAIILLILPRLLSNSFLFNTKFNQFFSMISFWRSDWLSSMDSSPKMRITEFINIGFEYLLKPWFLFFGKGFMGSIQDKLNLFDNVTTFAFSEWEVTNSIYFTMHESINSLFLTNGLCGIFFLFSNLHYMIKNIDKSPWLIFGFLWLLLFYSYSLTISIYGVISLVIGFIEADNKDKISLEGN
ncbi:hypothetical protein ACWOEH_08735 [Enterococcus nangangensis]